MTTDRARGTGSYAGRVKFDEKSGVAVYNWWERKVQIPVTSWFFEWDGHNRFPQWFRRWLGKKAL